MDDKRILVVDDDDAIRTLLFTIFRRRGFKVDSARNGSEAIQRLARCHYAVVLLDLMMPHVNGYEVLDEMAKSPRGQRPVVIVFSAGGELATLPPEIVCGIVKKPFDLALLNDTISACVNIIATRAQRDGCPPAESDCPFPN